MISNEAGQDMNDKHSEEGAVMVQVEESMVNVSHIGSLEDVSEESHEDRDRYQLDHTVDQSSFTSGCIGLHDNFLGIILDVGFLLFALAVFGGHG